MKKINFKFLNFLCIILFFMYPLKALSEENHKNEIISYIINLKNNIESKNKNNYIFLSFWDFDGTILKGDCSEGLIENNNEIYKGLAEILIRKGYSNIYNSRNGFENFIKDYKYMESNIGKWLAYPFLIQIFRGADVNEIKKISKEYFDNTLKNYYFKSSIEILKTLEKNNIRNYIISASSDIFVKSASDSLKLPEERFNGIKLEIKNGKLTEKIVYPVTLAEGKTEKIMSIVNYLKKQNQKKKIIILSAFGNSYQTDGDFMKYIVKQKLPIGNSLGVMINGGEEPKEFRGLFLKVKQNETFQLRD